MIDFWPITALYLRYIRANIKRRLFTKSVITDGTNESGRRLPSEKGYGWVENEQLFDDQSKRSGEGGR